MPASMKNYLPSDPRSSSTWQPLSQAKRKQTFRKEFQEFIDGYDAPSVETWGALKEVGKHLGDGPAIE